MTIFLFFEMHQIENICAKKRKFEPIDLILFLKNIFFAEVTAEARQKHTLILRTYQMTSRLEIACANLML